MPIEPMHDDLKLRLEEYRKQRGFDPVKWADQKCEMFNDYCRNAGMMRFCGRGKFWLYFDLFLVEIVECVLIIDLAYIILLRTTKH